MHLLVNIVAFQAGWFACVLGAAWGMPGAGVAIALAIVVAHVLLVAAPAREVALVALAGAFGAVFDSALVAAGIIDYPHGLLLHWAAPAWIVAMWLLFAITLNHSLRWLRGRAVLAALLGAVGGPLAFLAGERLGAVVFPERTLALAALAVGWAVAMPLLMRLSERYDGTVAPVEPVPGPGGVA